MGNTIPQQCWQPVFLGQRYNVADDSALEKAKQFLNEFRGVLSDGSRNQLLVACARVASARYGVARAECFLEEIADPENLAPTVRYNFLIVQLMRHAYFGDVAQWKRTAAAVDVLLRDLRADAIVGIESALALTGIYLGQNAAVEEAISRAYRVERQGGLRGLRAYNAAVDAAYLFQRGRLGDATARIGDVLSCADVMPAVIVALPIAALLAAATGDASLWRRFDAGHLRHARETHDDLDAAMLLGAHAGLLAAGDGADSARLEVLQAVDSLERACPDAMYVLITAARILPHANMGRVVELVQAAARNGGGVEAAIGALVLGIVETRFGTEGRALAFGREAATAFAALGWPLLEAEAHAICGAVARASRLYADCGAAASASRLGSMPPAGEIAALSSRENQIVILVAKGLTNAEIASELNIGNKTVEKHVSSVFGKLGLRSRSQVAAYLAAASHEA